MLGLAHQVRGHDMRVRRPIGQNQTVGRPRNHVDAHAAKEDPLGLGHKLVARTHQDVRLWQAKEAKGHGRDPLNPAHGQDLVRPANMRGIDDRRGHAHTGPGRRTGGDVLAARNGCGGHGHNGRRDMAIPPTGHIAARRIHRDRLLTHGHARHNLIFHVLDGALLSLGKAADIVMGKPDIRLQLLRHQRTGGFNLSLRQHHIALIPIKLRRILQSCSIPTNLNRTQYLTNRRRNVRGARAGGQGRTFYIFDGHGTAFFLG
mmetsp:Transcript_29622/g.58555  ORF Transcript_29622/g.58555 Transcript_29622/m.58555 type:complete len:260 (+) Transcript_29622:652-1431(+)